ncbi:MAG: septal ring lytic transglycosylase RlpA family protein [bacterium]|nr:septal ring lytic transglycosylase RlpA family protein [bacterium]
MKENRILEEKDVDEVIWKTKVVVFYFIIVVIFLFVCLFFVVQKISNQKKVSTRSYSFPLIASEFSEVKPQKTEWLYHTVKPGDSIYGIAQKFKVLQYQIRGANKMVPGGIIHPGQVLKIPVIGWKSYEGKASWYGPRFHGRKRADGRIYDQNEVLVAHRVFPLGMKVRVTNLLNGRTVVAPVLDRGPYVVKDGKYDREIDLSLGAARALGAVKKGVIPVRIEPLG